MVIKFDTGTEFKNTEKFLSKAANFDNAVYILEKYGQIGVDALSAATPVDTGLTAASWSYHVKKTSTGYNLYWSNSNKSDGIPIVILIQYGHATRGGGYVSGIDFVNPALRPVFDAITDDITKELQSI